MLTLIIGNKELSSWSLRPWLVLRHYGLEFREVRLPLDTPEFFAQIVRYSGAMRVPVLLERGTHLGLARDRRIPEREGRRAGLAR